MSTATRSEQDILRATAFLGKQRKENISFDSLIYITNLKPVRLSDMFICI